MIRQTPQILITSQTSGEAFYAEFAIGVMQGTRVRPQAGGAGTVEATRTNGTFQSVAVELTGAVTAGEAWSLTLRDTRTGGLTHTVTYTTVFGDTLSKIAAELGRLAGGVKAGDPAVRFDLDDGLGKACERAVGPQIRRLQRNVDRRRADRGDFHRR